MRDGADNMSRPSARTKQNRPTREASRPLHKNMVWVPGGTFLMGSNDFYPEERPVHRVAFDGLHRCGVQYLDGLEQKAGNQGISWRESRPLTCEVSVLCRARSRRWMSR
jgi:hypothetical protein